MNVQFAIQGEGDAATVFVLEVNPRASRTVPFVSKATGQPLAKIAARCMVGQSLHEQKGADGREPREVVPPYFSVKEAVFPFNKFPGVDPILGPEMRSTGEVMGVGATFGEAMLKSQIGAGSRLPAQGTAVVTVKNADKARAVQVAADLVHLGFQVVATKGTAAAIASAGIPVKTVNKVMDGRPHIVDMVKAGEIQLVFSTVDETRTAIADSRHIRTAALAQPRHLLHHDGRLRGGHRSAEAPGRPEREVVAGTARRTELKFSCIAPPPPSACARKSARSGGFSFPRRIHHEHHPPDTTRQ